MNTTNQKSTFTSPETMQSRLRRSMTRLGKKVALLCGSACILAQPLLAAETTIIQDNLNSPEEQWTWGGERKNGNLLLTSSGAEKFDGAQILLKTPFSFGKTDFQSTHIHLKVNGFGDENGGNAIGEAKMFIVPEPLKNPNFADPYNEANAISLIVAFNTGKKVLKISLFKKIDQNDPGYGVLLCESTQDMGKFPLVIDWYLSFSGYKLKVEPEGKITTGVTQDAWILSNAWSGDLRFAMRIVNVIPKEKAQMRISDFSIASGPVQ